MRSVFNIYTTVLSALLLFSCVNDEIDSGLPMTEKVVLDIPNYFPELTYDFAEYPLTNNGVTLGRKLFYDGRLSADNTIACAFCHLQENAFTHHGHSLSHGINNQIGIRNTPSLTNVGFYKNFSWDGAIHHLDEFSLIPITTDFEMDESIENILEKLSKDKEYLRLFKSVYGTETIKGPQLLNALSQFMVTMISSQSAYDDMMQNKRRFNSEEEKGYQLFQQHCASCHKGALQTDFTFRDNGLSYNPRTADVGRMRVSLEAKDSLKFRVPSLRNVELTAPYMHDGRFRTLEAVLLHYTENLQNNPNLDPILKMNDGRLGLELNTEEQRAIIVFLKTLTDNDFINRPQLSEPFKEK